MTAELTGFLPETQIVQVRAGEARALEFRLRLDCIGERSPPLTVLLPFDQMLIDVDAAAHVRIHEVGNRERLITDDACLFVRRYVTEVRDAINMTTNRGKMLLLLARGWDPVLAPRDELITLLQWESLLVPTTKWVCITECPFGMGASTGRFRPNGGRITNGDPVERVLNSLRTSLRQRRPRRQ